MRLLLNVIWFVFAGVWMAIGYAFAALIMFILIITIPFGVAALRIGIFALWPFGKTVVRRADAGAGSAIGNVLWFLPRRLVADHRPSGHRRTAVPDDHRDPPRSRELQIDPGHAPSVRAGHRFDRAG
jgi:hypothetical protein